MSARARTLNATRNAQRRKDEHADALDFLVYGDEGDHAERCVHAEAGGVACCRDYDPRPYPEAEPIDRRMYEGTGVGALYGFGAEHLLGGLAGWNLVAEGGLA